MEIHRESLAGINIVINVLSSGPKMMGKEAIHSRPFILACVCLTANTERVCPMGSCCRYDRHSTYCMIATARGFTASHSCTELQYLPKRVMVMVSYMFTVWGQGLNNRHSVYMFMYKSNMPPINFKVAPQASIQLYAGSRLMCVLPICKVYCTPWQVSQGEHQVYMCPASAKPLHRSQAMSTILLQPTAEVLSKLHVVIGLTA